MRTIILFLVLLNISFPLFAQHTIKGTVQNVAGEPIPGANIYMEESFEGATAGVDGDFEISSSLQGNQIVIASCIGYEMQKLSINVSENNLCLNIVMKEAISALDAVVITAGAFDTNDRSRSEVLKPLDIVTTAGATADVPGVLNTLPGTQKVGETGKLFVRGGSSWETGTYIDGLKVAEPYNPSPVGIPSRFRFSPFLFNGTFFSTGGYSAEYGQALSSVLVLNTKDQLIRDQTDISLMSVGGGISHSKMLKKGSLFGELNYTNLTPYYCLIPQKTHWLEEPESINGTFFYRMNGEKGEVFKVYSNYEGSDFSLEQEYPNPDDGLKKISVRNDYLRNQVSYRALLNDDWGITGGVSYTFQNKKTDLETDRVREKLHDISGKVVLDHESTNKIGLKGGVELNNTNYNEQYDPDTSDVLYKLSFDQLIVAGFAEADIHLSTRLLTRIGARYEYLADKKQHFVDPRVSLAYKTGEHEQVSIAYGTFHQTPYQEYYRINPNLDQEKASHIIFNFQHSVNNKTFRIEAYRKVYDNLVKISEGFVYEASTYTNSGDGYANGIEFFWRDAHSIENLDYWLSYSFIDSEKKYLSHPYGTTPSTISKHTFSLVSKYFITKLRSQLGVTFYTSSGRPYNDPDKEGFNESMTKPYVDLGVNWSFLLKPNIIIHGSVSNVTGSKQVFGYNFSNADNPSGNHNRVAVEPPAKRFFFLGCFISLSKDKQANILNNL
jgi:outer membrane cobalamin receptor